MEPLLYTLDYTMTEGDSKMNETHLYPQDIYSLLEGVKYTSF